MQPTLARIDLADPEAQRICLACGERFVDPVASCPSCLSTNQTSPAEVVDLLRSAAPGREVTALARLALVPLPGLSDAAQIARIREALAAAGTPYLLASAGGALLSPSSGDEAGAILVPEAELATIQARLPAWLGLAPEGAEPGSAGPVPIWEGGEAEAMVIGARLEQAEVPFALRHAPAQFGLTVGDFGPSRILVESWDVERARTAMEAPPEAGAGVEAPPDAGRGRLRRKHRIARYLLVAAGLSYLLIALVLAGTTFWALTVFHAAVGAVLLSLAAWSRREPERAFGVALLILIPTTLSWIWIRLPVVLAPGVLVLLAVFYAYEGSVKASRGGNR